MLNLIRQKFGRLKVTSFVRTNESRQREWLCQCDCGGNKTVTTGDLNSGNVKSCGCLRQSGNQTKHGHARNGKPTRTYKIWDSVKQRCLNRKNKDYENYGGRGIRICRRWLKFENFLRDMKEYPTGHSIDRIDNNKSYCKGNCRWATPKEQARNKKNNHTISFDGKTQCLTAWAEEYNILPNTLYMRLSQYRWSVEKAIKTPTRKKVKSSDKIKV